ncbi:MAG TPA: RcpC/CpaB family pilus assembly protein [Streptosporangiaceae bacterium]|nr:RcpC/CpaB family pilus assembly protein [Streptosporangiaceae bacterium]
MTRRILTIVLAIVLAVIGTGAVLIYVRQADARAIAGQKAVTVLVATQQIPAGTSASSALQDGLLDSQKLPASSVPADAVRSLSPALGAMVMSANVASGQLLLRPMLVTSLQATAGIAIPPGMVAVTVELCMPEAVAGYIGAGSQVAVFDTYAAHGGGAPLTAQPNCTGPHQQQAFGAAHTRIVLPKVLVISVGSAASPGSSSSSATTSTAFTQTTSPTTQNTVLVTLAVNQADAERLINLTETGLPYLALLTPSSGTGPDTTIVPLLPPLK